MQCRLFYGTDVHVCQKPQVVVSTVQNEAKIQHEHVYICISFCFSKFDAIFYWVAMKEWHCLVQVQERVRKESIRLVQEHPTSACGQIPVCIRTLTNLRKVYLFPGMTERGS